MNGFRVNEAMSGCGSHNQVSSPARRFSRCNGGATIVERIARYGDGTKQPFRFIRSSGYAQEDEMGTTIGSRAANRERKSRGLRLGAALVCAAALGSGWSLGPSRAEASLLVTPAYTVGAGPSYLAAGLHGELYATSRRLTEWCRSLMVMPWPAPGFPARAGSPSGATALSTLRRAGAAGLRSFPPT